ncbi:NfeD family protein [Methylotenera sp. L2L1]|uniref:NfeD family protein n=1 Tax=Methylotenera sp. L2L1 TaxID=1502770 RepID=UPI000567717B|nr:NfeD family protein [Methylotenera sp. L2L1]
MIESAWIWGALGLILLAVEMATGTFYVLWFGIAGLFVAFALWLFPSLSIGIQLVMYAALSLGSLAIWKLNCKKIETHSRVGQAQGEEIGRIGTMIETSSASQNGKIRFTQGLMGSKEWVAVSNETIESGKNAKVVAVEGNTLRVQAN